MKVISKKMNIKILLICSPQKRYFQLARQVFVFSDPPATNLSESFSPRIKLSASLNKILQSQELAWDGIELSDNVVVLKVRSEIQFNSYFPSFQTKPRRQQQIKVKTIDY